MTATCPERIEILDTPITVFDSYEQASNFIVGNIRRKQKGLCIAVNPIKAYRSWQDKQLRSVLKSADICLCDGVGMAAAVRILRGRAIPRITGIQLFLELVMHAEAHGLKIFLLGAKPESNQAAYKRLHERHPKLKIVGRNHGYFLDNDAVIEKINNSRADMLFVAMGSPRQEKWLAKYRGRIDASFCMGVGGSLDVLGGLVKRAPHAFQKTGTEWLYRLVVQPRRLREQIVLPLFVLRLFLQYLMPSSVRKAQVALGRTPQTHGGTPRGTSESGRQCSARTTAAHSQAGMAAAFGQDSSLRTHRQPRLAKSYDVEATT